MTNPVDQCNNALIKIGSQRIISSLTQDSVEAKACNTFYPNTRDNLLRMAPWNCAMKTINLVYITSVPGTPENTSTAAALWAPGLPRPPWAYEYQYPSDCLKPCWLIPAYQTGVDGVPITTAITGWSPTTNLGGPIPYKVGVDVFYPVVIAAIAARGLAYAVGEILTMPGTVQGDSPIGAPVKLLVTSADGDGQILSVLILTQVPDASPPLGGSYFAVQSAAPTAPASTTGVGIGATFNLTFSGQGYQRVILTNQQNATMVYVAQVTDPNVWDPLFQEAFQCALAAELSVVLTKNKDFANNAITKANAMIIEARKADANEGLTINDITPDWIRGRGIAWADSMDSGPYSSFDWGGLYSGWA